MTKMRPMELACVVLGCLLLLNTLLAWDREWWWGPLGGALVGYAEAAHIWRNRQAKQDRAALRTALLAEYEKGIITTQPSVTPPPAKHRRRKA